MDLSSYQVSPKTGFLPETPPRRLRGPQLERWEETARRIPELIKSGQLASAVDELPSFPLNELEDEGDWRRAYSVLGFLANAYLWGSAPQPTERIPPVISTPYLAVCRHHELPPTITYANSALWNWTGDPEADWSVAENLHTLTSFTGTIDEEWFYLASTTVEAAGMQPFRIIMATMDAVERGDSTKAGDLLRALPETLERLGVTLDRVWEKCDPGVFYHVLRPFLQGGKGMENVGLPNGVHFDTGDGRGEWLKIAGGSAAQSSLFAFFDVALGVQHFKAGKVDTQSALNEIRYYMPGPHRRFLEAVERRSRIRDFCTSESAPAGVVEAYNQALRSIADFRQRHIRIAKRFIAVEAKRGLPSLNKADDEKVQGTGGTPLEEFLGQNRDNTLAGVIAR